MSSFSAESPCKKQKTTKSVVDPGPVYTLQCLVGNPELPLPSWIKTSKKAVIQQMLAKQGLDTTGTKEILLHRLQKEVPNVIFEFDGNKILNKMVGAFLHYLVWDKTRLYTAIMPRRGDLLDGALTLRNEMPIGLSCMSRIYTKFAEEFGEDPENWPIHSDELKRIRQKLGTTYTVQDLRRIEADMNALGTKRVLEGSVAQYAPMPFPKYSFHDLQLEEGDEIIIRYNYNCTKIFRVKVLKVEHNRELEKDGSPCCAKLLSRGKAKLYPSYEREEWRNEDRYVDDIPDDNDDH